MALCGKTHCSAHEVSLCCIANGLLYGWQLSWRESGHFSRKLSDISVCNCQNCSNEIADLMSKIQLPFDPEGGNSLGAPDVRVYTSALNS